MKILLFILLLSAIVFVIYAVNTRKRYYDDYLKKHKPRTHTWDDQDRCIKCGDKDWFADKYCSK